MRLLAPTMYIFFASALPVFAESKKSGSTVNSHFLATHKRQDGSASSPHVIVVCCMGSDVCCSSKEAWGGGHWAQELHYTILAFNDFEKSKPSLTYDPRLRMCKSLTGAIHNHLSIKKLKCYKNIRRDVASYHTTQY